MGAFTDLFSIIDQKYRIYRKKPARNRVPLTIPIGKKTSAGVQPQRQTPDLSLQGFDPIVEANRILGTYGPPSVLVNESMDILQFSGKIGPYLEPVQGTAGLTLNKMIHRDLLVDLRTAIHTVRTSGKPVRKGGVRIIIGERSRSVGFTVVPVHSSLTPGTWHYLIVIEDESPSRDVLTGGGEGAGPLQEGEPVPLIPGPEEYWRMEQELADTREHLRAMIEEEHKVGEDLLSAFNELQSQNEELQSINEEWRRPKKNSSHPTRSSRQSTRNCRPSLPNGKKPKPLRAKARRNTGPSSSTIRMRLSGMTDNSVTPMPIRRLRMSRICPPRKSLARHRKN